MLPRGRRNVFEQQGEFEVKKIMMLAAVGVLSICSVMAQDTVSPTDELKKNVTEAEKVFRASNNKYNSYIRKNMPQECKDARKAVVDADDAALTQRIKMLQADTTYAQAATKYAAVREEYLKTKKKEAKSLEAAARKEFDAAWKESKKAASDEYKAMVEACSATRKAMEKADNDFRAANEEAAKLWEARMKDYQTLSEAKKAYNAAIKGKGKGKSKSKGKGK